MLTILGKEYDRMVFDFNRAVFTYAISNNEIDFFNQHYKMQTQELIINYTDATDIHHSMLNEQEVIIVGLCIDSYELIDRHNIAFEIANLKEKTIEAVCNFANRLSGKYIIIYSNSSACYIVGDATCSIPANYSGNLIGPKRTSTP